MRPTSSSLLRHVRDLGDAQAWEELLLQYESYLLSFVRRLGVRRDDAPDVVQEVTLKAECFRVLLAIKSVADDRMTDSSQMNSDLMGYACLNVDVH